MQGLNGSILSFRRLGIAAALALALASVVALAEAPKKPSVPAKPAARPAVKPAGRPGATAGRPGGSGRPGGARPGGEVARRPGGGTTEHARNGGTIDRRSNGRMEAYHGANGREARFGADGRPREVRANGMVITHGPGGGRRVVVDRADRSRLVVEGRGRGYIQRPYMSHGQAYFHRTSYYHGRAYSSYYRPYYYHNLYLQRYAVYHYYPAAYYGWAYAPWVAPVPYAWGWGAAPWYGYYGAYFAPYPVYPSAALWVADFVISASLAEAYQAQMEAGPGPNARLNTPAHLVYASYSPTTSGNQPELTADVKQGLANEVQDSIAAEKAGGDNSTMVLDDGKPHLFLVSAGLQVNDSTGQECNLTEGDVLTLVAPPATAADQTASLQVTASKAQDCAKDATVQVKLDDLQEMRNHLLSSVDQGLGELKTKAGTGGLPALPADAQADGQDADFVASAPPADADGAAQIDQQAQQATVTEQQVVAEANSQGAPAAGQAGETTDAAAPAAAPAGSPVTIALGQTPEQVTAGKGSPRQIINLGAKKIYVYPDMKIIFMNGKVSDVQ